MSVQKLRFSAGDAPTVHISLVAGDVRLTGWDRPEVVLEGAPEALRGSADQDQLSLESSADASVYLPRAARVTVAQVIGDARVKFLDGRLEIDAVNGDLDLRKTAGVRVGRVAGDLTAKKVDGDLTLEAVMGDLSVREVQGQFRAADVSGDLYLRGVSGPAEGRARGDLTAYLNLITGQAYHFESDADLNCRIQPGAGARVHLQADGDLAVQVSAPLKANGDVQQAHAREFTLGDGGAELTLSARGDLSLAEQEVDWDPLGDPLGEDFGQRLAAEIDSQVAGLNQQIHEQINQHIHAAFGAGGLAGIDVERITRQARHTAERAQAEGERARRQAERLQEKFERVRERAELRAEQAGRRAEAAGHRRAYSVHVSAGRQPAGDPVSDEECLSILRMLEKGAINVEQAEKLLAALEGKG
ncbi:MAG: hypothetical protein HY784_09965 [Chloroflexi bacterium]|nr:hypothetical protein [Chloroflexota bacterium]